MLQFSFQQLTPYCSMMPPLRQTNVRYRLISLLAAMLATSAVNAGITYKLEQTHAVAGETVHVRAVVFNDTESAMSWAPPENLVIQWRDPKGKTVRSLAYLEKNPGPVNVPVNNFVKLSWRAVVPSGVTGLQAVNVE